MSELRKTLLGKCLKPEEIVGDIETKDARVRELVRWFERFSRGEANPKWAMAHAYELAHYAAEIKGM